MIIYKNNSNIFDSTAEYLINPVNTKGISGAGLALDFKTKFPDNYRHYHEYCKVSTPKDCKVSTPKGGDLIWYIAKPEEAIKGSRNIINFCTKEIVRQDSKIEWIEKGIKNLVEILDERYSENEYPTPLLAIPMLGCGHGKLEKVDVVEILVREFANKPYDVEIYL